MLLIHEKEVADYSASGDIKEAGGGDCAGRVHLRTLFPEPDFVMAWGTGKAITAAPSGSGRPQTRREEEEGRSVFLLLSRCILFL